MTTAYTKEEAMKHFLETRNENLKVIKQDNQTGNSAMTIVSTCPQAEDFFNQKL